MWWLTVAAFAAAPDVFLEVPAPGPPPYAFGPYWQCSLAGASPVCTKLEQHRSGGPLTVEPWTHPVPTEAGKLAQLVGTSQGPLSLALDGEGVVWFLNRETGAKAPETRGTTRIASNGGLICGTTATGAWCSDVWGETAERVKLPIGPLTEVVADGDIAGFVAKDGRVALVHYPYTATGGLAKNLAWAPALKGVMSLAVLDAVDVACGVSADGKLVCVALAAPDHAISFGSEAIGALPFYQDGKVVPIEGVRFTAVETVGVAMIALADDGRAFVFRPPDTSGEVFAADGVALLGNGCIERKSGPWWCLR
jgi:hypothetical protein